MKERDLPKLWVEDGESERHKNFGEREDHHLARKQEVLEWRALCEERRLAKKSNEAKEECEEKVGSFFEHDLLIVASPAMEIAQEENERERDCCDFGEESEEECKETEPIPK